MPGHEDRSLGTDKGVSEFVIVVYGPAVTFGFPYPRIGTYGRSALHLSLISVIHGSTLYWCAQNVLREAMSQDLLFGKLADSELIAINFNNHFGDRMGEVEREHVKVYPKFRNLRPYDKTNREMSRIPILLTAYRKLRKKTKNWNDFRRLTVEIPEQPLIVELVSTTSKYRKIVGQGRKRQG